MEHPANFPKAVHCFPQLAGKQYTPSNGTEGDIFMESFCYQCRHEKYSHTMNTDDLKCEILSASLMHEKPEEWIWSNLGYPICTKWQFWDWDGEDGNLNEPPPLEPEDPSQLLLPFDITDLFGFDDPEILVTKKAIIERELVYG